MGDHGKELIVHKAKIAEQAERYEDMVKFMKAVVIASGGTLNQEERNMFSVAYNKFWNSKSAFWKVLDSITRKEITMSLNIHT